MLTWVDENNTVFIFSFYIKWVPFPRSYHGKEKCEGCFLYFRRVRSNMLTEINMLRHCVLVQCFSSTVPRLIEK